MSKTFCAVAHGARAAPVFIFFSAFRIRWTRNAPNRPVVSSAKRLTHRIHTTLLAGSLLLCGPAAAGDLILGLGRDNIGSGGTSEGTALHLEYQSDALLSFGWGAVTAPGVIEIDDQSDRYAGAGIAALWNASERWFVEASVAAGYYDHGARGVDLGGHLQFRTLVGFGYRLSEATRLSLSVDHLSNGGLKDVNPGRDAVFLRVARSF